MASLLTQFLLPKPKAFKICLWLPHPTSANPIGFTYRIIIILTTATLIQATISCCLGHRSGHLMPSQPSLVCHPYLQLFSTKQPEGSSETDSNSVIPPRLLHGLFTALNTKSKVLIMIYRDLLQIVPAPWTYLSKFTFLSFFKYSKFIYSIEHFEVAFPIAWGRSRSPLSHSGLWSCLSSLEKLPLPPSELDPLHPC